MSFALPTVTGDAPGFALEAQDELPVEQWTYDLRLGWRNTDERPAAATRPNGGAVFRTPDGRAWITKQGLPVLLPDHWADREARQMTIEQLPRGGGLQAIDIKGNIHEV